jgi:hypothetical protein
MRSEPGSGRPRAVVALSLALVLVLLAAQVVGDGRGTGVSGVPTPTVPLGAVAPDASGPLAEHATSENFEDTLAFPSGGSYYLYAESTASTGGTASPFEYGELISANGSNGLPVAALAMTPSNTDAFTTDENHWSIGGVEIVGSELSPTFEEIEVPPVEPTVYLNLTFTVASSALVVIVLIAGGECCLSAAGVPSLSVLTLESFAGGNAIEIADANLSAGQYTVSESSYNHDSGGTGVADLVGVFGFGPTPSSVPPPPGTPSSTPSASPLVLPWWLWTLFGAGIGALVVGLLAVVALRRRPPSTSSPAVNWAPPRQPSR